MKKKLQDFYDNNKKKILLTGLIAIFILVFLLVGNMRHKDPAEIEENPPYSELSVREDITGKAAVTLGEGDYIVGEKIAAGRYMATNGGNDFGSLIVYELDTNIPEVSEVLGYFSETAYVPCVALTLIDGQRIRIVKLDNIVFKPLKTELLSELTTGVWEAGLDIEPGTYEVSSKEAVWGSITILEGIKPAGYVRLKEEMPKGIVTLKAGQTIRISGIPTVVFEKLRIEEDE
ncbi:MAG: hypothetical protein FWE47_01885 [Oscillospiraceae bacterium]|nr:hypothetical protein [Oscillospiraceae bacterium]